MHQYDPDAEEYTRDQRRPFGLALLSSIFFGVVGTAASYWFALKTIPHSYEAGKGLAAKWMGAAGGIFSAIVAFHGARHVPKEQIEKHVSKPLHENTLTTAPKVEHIPASMISAKDAFVNETLAPESKNLGL